MCAVQAGGDRQALHECIRVHSRAAVERMKGGAADNDLFDRLAADPAFGKVRDSLRAIVEGGALVGRAPEQVTEFLEGHVEPALKRLRGGARPKLQSLDV